MRLAVIEASGVLGDWETARQQAARFLADYGGVFPDLEKRVRGVLDAAPK